MGAQHTALAVADKLIRLSRENEIPVTPMQVQKLAYFCHAWHLALGYGPMFQDAVESWQYGPVIRTVYHALKHYGGDPIREPLQPEEAQFAATEAKVINAVWEQYGEIDGLALSRLTHAIGSPWHQVYSRGEQTQIIPNHLIRDYYAGFIRLREQ